MSRSEIYLGIMSGTSLDGIDVAAVRFEGSEARPADAELEAFRTVPFSADLEGRLRSAIDEKVEPAELCDLNFALGEELADAVADLADAYRGHVVAIGSHGQTIYHRPPRSDVRGSTLQIGEPAVIAERTGCDVIADFRVRDVAAGGHGAPFAPLFDQLLLADDVRSRAIQNIGGMGNVTALPPSEADVDPIAFDTGPGVALLDAAVHHMTGGAARWDEDGRLAASGTADELAVAEWLSDPFFLEAPPRSTGRERFGASRVVSWLSRNPDLTIEDAAATLTEVTARSIATSYGMIGFDIDEVFLAGGGARNPEIRRRLADHLPGTPLRGLEELGWNPDAREAAAFALLARQHVLEHAVDLGWATGASGPRVLGKRVPA